MRKPFQIIELIKNIDHLLSQDLPEISISENRVKDMQPTLLKSRSHKRYRIQDKVIAIAFRDICQLSDISIGGAAIKFKQNGELPPRWSLDICIFEDEFNAKIPVKLVWEKDIPPVPGTFPKLFTKCAGVQFDDLTAEIRSKIDYLIKMHEEYVIETKPLVEVETT